jgi:polysaccharide biosynthesis transport protein
MLTKAANEPAAKAAGTPNRFGDDLLHPFSSSVEDRRLLPSRVRYCRGDDALRRAPLCFAREADGPVCYGIERPRGGWRGVFHAFSGSAWGCSAEYRNGNSCEPGFGLSGRRGHGRRRSGSNFGGGDNIQRAASFIAGNLKVESPRKSTILDVSLRHPDPALVQPLLSNLVRVYLGQHLAIHRGIGSGSDKFFEEQTMELRSRIKKTQLDLQTQRDLHGIISVTDSKRTMSDELSQLRREQMTVESEMATQLAMLEAFEKMTGRAGSGGTNQTVSPEAVARQKKYQANLTQLEGLRRAMDTALARFTEDHPSVQVMKRQIETAEAKQAEMEKEDPKLASMGLVASGTEGAKLDVASIRLRLSGLEARFGQITNQLARVRTDSKTLSSAEGTIRALERQLESDENSLKRFEGTTEQMRLDTMLGIGNIPNIKTLEKPTPAGRDVSMLQKLVAGASVGGLVLGLLLAVLVEFFIDQSVRRPAELEMRFRLPVMLSIPDAGRTPGNKKVKGQLAGPGGRATAAVGVSEQYGSLQPGLTPFFDALRDRTVMLLERLLHKPKLVAVTGCRTGAGVSTTAAGLALALSQTSEGRVLLVEMGPGKEVAHPVLNGVVGCALAEALDEQTRDAALVQENLYYATLRDGPDKTMVPVPKRLAGLVPKLKASDYDYVIFDLPTVSPTSITPRLAGLMDVVLLMVESEKDQRASVERANRILQDAKANVVAVLNRTRNYVPKWLSHEAT